MFTLGELAGATAGAGTAAVGVDVPNDFLLPGTALGNGLAPTVDNPVFINRKD